MSRAIVIRENGGPEVLRLEEREVGAPGPGQVKLRQAAIGLNFIDVYHRTGLYKMELPLTPGVEAAGVVTAVGEGVADFHPGDRVAYAGTVGAYAEERLIAADKLVRVPDGISFDTAATISGVRPAVIRVSAAVSVVLESSQLRKSPTVRCAISANASGE